jgi:hypothetical protein
MSLAVYVCLCMYAYFARRHRYASKCLHSNACANFFFRENPYLSMLDRNRRTCMVLGIALTRLKAEEANLVRANII